MKDKVTHCLSIHCLCDKPDDGNFVPFSFWLICYSLSVMITSDSETGMSCYGDDRWFTSTGISWTHSLTSSSSLPSPSHLYVPTLCLRDESVSPVCIVQHINRQVHLTCMYLPCVVQGISRDEYVSPVHTYLM